MKSFQQFIIEARSTLASQKANQMGLKSSGHGDYYDQQGRLVAKTVGGQLQFFKGRKSKSTQEAPAKSPTRDAQPQNINIQPQEQPIESPKQDEVKGVVVTIGRFNPPAKNLEQPRILYSLSRNVYLIAIITCPRDTNNLFFL